tara:strand:+ start:202 stop:414 length:213 start_codon:yes stop_codon:yes gene_type:complete
MDEVSINYCVESPLEEYKACVSEDYAIALRKWTPLGEQGAADTQVNLGILYETGKAAPQTVESLDCEIES